MPKTCTTYVNALAPSSQTKWTVIDGTHDKLRFMTLAIDEASGDYTRLTEFLPGANTAASGAKSHDYPE